MTKYSLLYVTKGRQKKEVVVERKYIKEEIRKLNEQGWRVRSSTGVDYTPEGDLTGKYIGRYEKAKEGFKEPEPVPTVVVGDKKVGVSEGVAKKIEEEVVPKQEHEARRQEQIEKGVIKTPAQKFQEGIEAIEGKKPEQTEKVPVRETSTKVAPRPELPEEKIAREQMYELQKQETRKQFQKQSLPEKAVGYIVTASSPEAWKAMTAKPPPRKKGEKHTYGRELVVEALTRKKLRARGKTKPQMFGQQFMDVLSSPIGFQLTSGIETELTRAIATPRITDQGVIVSKTKTEDLGNLYRHTTRGKMRYTVESPLDEFLSTNVFKEWKPRTVETDIVAKPLVSKGDDVFDLAGVYGAEVKLPSGKTVMERGRIGGYGTIEKIDDMTVVRGSGFRASGQVGELMDIDQFGFYGEQYGKVGKGVKTQDQLRRTAQPSTLQRHLGFTMGDEHASVSMGLSRTFEMPSEVTIDVIKPTKQLGKLKPFPGIKIELEQLTSTPSIIAKEMTTKPPPMVPVKTKQKWDPNRLVSSDIIDVGYESITSPTITVTRRPDISSVTTTEPRPKLKTIPKTDPIRELSKTMSQVAKNTTRALQEPLITSGEMVKQAQGQSQIPSTRTVIGTKMGSKVGNIQDLMRTPVQIPTQAQSPRMGYRTMFRLYQPTLQTQMPRLPELIFKQPQVPTLIPKKLPRAKRHKPKLPFGTGFDVLVRKGGKWLKKTQEPLLKSEAMKLGAKLVETTPRASFRLVKSGRPASRKKIRYQFFPFKFRTPVPGSKLGRDVFIEKTKFRIDKPKELKGITFKGIEASRRKRKKFKPWKLM